MTRLIEEQSIFPTVVSLLERLSERGGENGVVDWGAPVPYFGDITRSEIATVGLNPSNREFVDDDGRELDGILRRFHTLTSLSIDSWREVDGNHVQMILDACRVYFEVNPYNRWFQRLEDLVSGVNATFYGDTSSACHLDLIPFATFQKWGSLGVDERTRLLDVNRDTLGRLLQASRVRLLILNGSSVVQHFQQLTGVAMEACEKEDWTLGRAGTTPVVGISFECVINEIAGVHLERDILVLGYNHNLQSSYGVTRPVMSSIRDWVARTFEAYRGKTEGPS